ncbi:hypothetical protein D3C73_905900 [compost metagenome]
MAGAVQHHLGHGLHAVAAFAAGFIINGLGQAIEVARLVQGAVEAEGTSGGNPGRAGALQAGAAQAVLALKLLQAGGQQFGLAVALGRAGDGIGVMAMGDGQGAGVQAAGRFGQGFLGVAAGAGALQALGLGAHGRGLGGQAAQIGPSDSEADDAAERRRCRRGAQAE